MPRFYIILLFCSITYLSFSQNLLAKYLKAAQEKYINGDYYYALELYSKAMEIDSNTIEILWNVAQTHRAYKDYRKAEYYYAKVFDREMAEIYPQSLLQLGLMQKQNGNYKKAIETFKRAKKKYAKNKKEYLYSKAKREIESCLWAMSMSEIREKGTFYQLPQTVNTKNAEFGHTIIDDKLIFSSLRADSISENEEVYQAEYSTQLFISKIENGEFTKATKWQNMHSETHNVGNATISIDKQRLYFSACENENNSKYKCKILVAKWHNNDWSVIDTLGEIINEPNANTTMPAIGEVDGQEALFFCSDKKKEGKGGLDIYFSTIKNGNQFSNPKPIYSINSPDDEVSPFWDNKQKRLYFSSSWHDGFGGLDVFFSQYENGTFQQPQNIGKPINSPANDLYFFQIEDKAYITSNRIGVLYSKNPTCCSDIFTFAKPKPEVIPEITPEETLQELNQRLPITLYFHNDVPNPKSWDTTTNIDYITTYNEYTDMLAKYQKEYSAGLSASKAQEAQEDIEDFFTEHVNMGVKNLNIFRELLLAELQKGVKIRMSIQGFASPLAQTDYNVNLTKRRIQSLINHLKIYKNGIFLPYIQGTATNGGKLSFEQIPFGEYTANQLVSDNPNDKKNSVYSRFAASERKIEIQSVSYIDQQEVFPLIVEPPVFNATKTYDGEKITAIFKLTNISDRTVTLLPNYNNDQQIALNINTTKIVPNQTVSVEITLNVVNELGNVVKIIEIPIENYKETARLIITTEVK